MTSTFKRKGGVAKFAVAVVALAVVLGVVGGWTTTAYAEDVFKVEVTQVTEPSVGATPDTFGFVTTYTSTSSGTSSSGSTNTVHWLCGTEPMNEEATFETNKTYTAWACIYASNDSSTDPWTLADNVTALFSDKPATLKRDEREGTKKEFGVGASYSWSFCEVRYHENGGTGTMEPTPFVVEYAVKPPVTLSPNTFIREGYTFAGWNTQADGQGDSYADGATINDLAQSLDLYAQWAPITYTISFDSNEGTGEMSPLTVQAGNSTKLSANTFVRDGYVFTGWNTAKDGTGTSYASEADVTPETNMTLYAQWHKIETPKPEVSTSAGGKIISKTDEVTFTISQKVPDDVTAMTIHFDLDPVMSYTSKAENVTVTVDGNKVAANVSLEGQKLAVTIDDAQTIASLHGKTVQVSFKAKVKSNADLTPYLNSAKNTALIPYKATTDFKGLQDRSASSNEEKLKVAVGGTTSTTSTKASTTSRGTLADTGDATSLAAVATLAICGSGFVFAGGRKRR